MKKFKSDVEILGEIYSAVIPVAKEPVSPMSVPHSMTPNGVTGGAIVIVKKEDSPVSKGQFNVKNEELGINVLVVSGDNEEVSMTLSSESGSSIQICGNTKTISSFISQLSLIISDLTNITRSPEESTTSCLGM